MIMLPFENSAYVLLAALLMFNEFILDNYTAEIIKPLQKLIQTLKYLREKICYMCVLLYISKGRPMHCLNIE